MKYGLFSLLLFFSFSALSQTKISGKMMDNKNRPLRGASIVIKDSYDGTTTDSLGNFSFTTTEKGQKILEATLIGYSSYQKNITIDGKSIVLTINVRELVTELSAVVITAGAFEASDKKKTTVLTPLDIVTTASAEGDITGALKTLPGTQQVGETGGLFVRGGTATESKIYIDGNLVNNFFYSSAPGIASRGRFNPFLFKGTIFSSGGYSALYGQALSSALILESTDLPEKTEAALGFSVIGVNTGIQKLAKNKKASWGITYSYTNLALAFAVIKQKQDYFTNPEYHEGDANFRIKTKGGMIKYYGYFSYGRFGFRDHDIDSVLLKDAFSLKNLNTYQNISWKENIGKGWKIYSGLSFSTNKDDLANELQDAGNNKLVFNNPAGYAYKNFGLVSHSWYAQARLVLEKRLSGLNMIRFGSDYFHSDEKAAYTLYDGTKPAISPVRDNLNAAFAEADFYVSNDIAVKLGSRLEHSQIMDQWNVAPRVSLAYKFKDKSQASLAYGIFYQNPESRYLPTLTPSIGFAKATHYIVQYQKTSTVRTFRTEVFYKQYNNLYKTAFDPNSGREVASNNDGGGYARGIEFFWRDKKTLKNVDYWISYSLLDTKRDYLNFPVRMEPSFAAKHTASFVIKKFVLPWKTGFNASYNFATGRPYYNLKNGGIADLGRTISYNNLGFSLNYIPTIGKKNAKGFTVWVLSISNVLGQKQVFNYNYGSINDRKEAIGPTSKRFVYIGCFMSFGIDRTQDAINNNL